MSNNSLENQIASHQHTISEALRAIDKANVDNNYNKILDYIYLLEKQANIIKNLTNPIKLDIPEPDDWQSVEVTAKMLFNWTEEDLFKGWVYRDRYKDCWLGYQPVVRKKYIRHKAEQTRFGKDYPVIEISEYGRKVLVELREKDKSEK